LRSDFEFKDGRVTLSQNPQVQELTLSVHGKLQDQFPGTLLIVCNESKVNTVNSRGENWNAVCD
jgi:hypothetical protein